MKLDRNIESNYGRGKYAVLKLRELADFERGTFGTLPADIQAAIKLLDNRGLLDWGEPGSASEFFLIRLKDKFALPALKAYANAAEEHDFVYASEIRELANRSGGYSKFCKLPD